MLEVILCTVLYIEDDPDDMFLFERAFSHASIPCDLRCVNSIEQARCYLLGEGEYADRQRFRLPDLIMTDLAVQGESALAFVEWLRNQPTFAKIAVACLTGSDDPAKLRQVADLGVSIVRKTSLFQDALTLIRKLVLP
jgi:CheY-like chemotaxis protein